MKRLFRIVVGVLIAPTIFIITTYLFFYKQALKPLWYLVSGQWNKISN